MKITSLKKKLETLGIETQINVRPMMTRDTDEIRGYVVSLTATDGHNDVSAQAHVMKDEVPFNSLYIAEGALKVATTDNVAVKRSNDESDSMTDYCAWTFFRSVKSLDYVFGKVAA